jgi:ATP-dependent helicase/nuclease subunit A
VNPEQRAAVEAAGEVFVSAGAGTGKTSVLVERFVRAVCEQGLDVESLLVITYTRKAAGELRARIRAGLRDRGRHDLALRLDGAWISTIHGFCSRLLRAHPFPVGLDPHFHELADDQAAVLRGEAFERALGAFCAPRDPERLRLLATYSTDGLRKMLTGVYETLRSAGRELRLELGEHAGVEERLAELHEAARRLAADPDASDRQLVAANAALALGGNPEQVLDLDLPATGDRAAEFRGARDRLQQAALEELAARDSELLQELLDLFASEYAAAKARESALDFEDLQLYARDLLRDDERVRQTEQLRFRSIMVDEFQDGTRTWPFSASGGRPPQADSR